MATAPTADPMGPSCSKTADTVQAPFLVPASKVDYEKLKEFKFTPPPDCPIFEPTEKEFAMGPIEYINKIRHLAEPIGICKIIPPKNFSVPFAIDTNEFHFSPRSQRLNELEALTRIKFNFYEHIHKFWDLQGVTLKISTVDRKILDMYTFHRVVKEEGGFEYCTRERKWAKIATRMEMNKCNATQLRQYYEKYLFPYDIFLSGATTGPEVIDSATIKQIPEDNKMEVDQVDNDPENETKQDLNENADPQNSELKKLQTYGAGPRMPGVICDDILPKGKFCHNCGDSSNSQTFLTCIKCENSFHKACLIPPFNETPKKSWHCHICLKKELAKIPQLYTKDFGFHQSFKTYSLPEFGTMANQFKSAYFSALPREVPLDIVEKEFWRIASSYDSSLSVEYGADLHTNDYGSGFPSKSSKMPCEEKDIESPWNLNNLPTLNGSVFKHINTNINGMIIPWMYVGMCFSAFCWHNEDHWTYSINYLHWGEPKIWYGVPGDKAEAFENAMRKIAPELFNSQPDLLHQLVTTCNPNVLNEYGVPIHKATQQAGEFIVTFPRSYHSGFNQGYNFAEAVNFASADWLPIGRLSIAHYASLQRYPVFSHDELICKMADGPAELEMRLAIATYEDILRMINCEKDLRMDTLSIGIANSNRNSFENLKDDERQCEYCHTTCFLSAIRCSCNNNKLVCLPHYAHLCQKCPLDKCTLLYRYSVDEMKIFKHKLEGHISQYQEWMKDTETVLKATRFEEKTTMLKLKELLDIAKNRKYNPYLEPNLTLENELKVAFNLQKICNDILAPPSQGHASLTCEQFRIFFAKVKAHPCHIEGYEQLNEISNKVDAIFLQIIEHIKPETVSTAGELKAIIDQIETLKCIDFTSFQLKQIKVKYLEADWLEKYERHFEKKKLVKLSHLNELITKGNAIPSSPPQIMEKINAMKRLYDAGSKFIDTIKRSLKLKDDDEDLKDELNNNPDPPSLDYLNALLKWHDRTEGLEKIDLEPYYTSLSKLIKSAQSWKEQAKPLCNGSKHISNDKLPMLKTVEEIMESGKKINCLLSEHRILIDQVDSAKAWIEELANTMIDKAFKYYRPIDAVLPRLLDSSTNMITRNFFLLLLRKAPFKDNSFEQQLDGNYSTAKIEEVYKSFVERESVYFEEIRSDRNHNRRKLVEIISDVEGSNELLSEKFCFCGRDMKDFMIECQLCLDWFHLSCVEKRNSGKHIKETDPANTQQLFICCLCTRGKWPKMREIEALNNKLKKLSVRTLEGELFKCHRNRIQLWIGRLKNELKNYPELKLLYNTKSSSAANREAISDEIRTILEDLLFQAYILGVDLDEIASLWRVFVALNPNRKTVLWYAGIPNNKRKGSLSWESKNRRKQKATTSSSKNDENGKPEKTFAAHSYDDDADYHYAFEACAMKDGCLKPNGKELFWVACDRCSLWFHQLCQGITKTLTSEETEKITFFCTNCRVEGDSSDLEAFLAN